MNNLRSSFAVRSCGDPVSVSNHSSSKFLSGLFHTLQHEVPNRRPCTAVRRSKIAVEWQSWFHSETMNAHSFDDVENRSTGSMLSMLDGQRQHRRLRSWVRCLDKVAEGAHVWPASALLIVGTLVMAVAWLCHMSVHSFSSTYLALKTETHLHDVITTIQQERRCSATCLTPSSPR